MKKIFKLNFYKTICFFIKKKKIYVFKKESIKINKLSNINIKGVVYLNKDYDNNPKNYKYGYLNINKNSVFQVNKKLILRPGVRLEIEDNAKLEIGDCSINFDSKIYCFDNITIGNNVIISENVIIRDSDNHSINKSEVSSPILIKDNVWIGMNSMILKGVTIGEGSVIAAGSVVIKDVPNNCLVAGVPAKIIKTNIKWEK